MRELAMTLEAVAVGLLALLVGLGFTFVGFRFFLILLPVWGFFAGFLFGAEAISHLLGDGFLATTLGWVVGFVVGIVFAVLSYLYYWVAVVFLGASIGYMAGLGLMHWLNNGGGLLAFTVGVIGAIIVAGATIVLRVPKYLILLLTSFGGAFAAVVGIALIFGRVPLTADTSTTGGMNGGILGAYVFAELSWVWPVAAIILGGIGFYYQLRTTERIEQVTYTAYMNPGMSGPTRV
jgi:hypothetical protein